MGAMDPCPQQTFVPIRIQTIPGLMNGSLDPG